MWKIRMLELLPRGTPSRLLTETVCGTVAPVTVKRPAESLPAGSVTDSERGETRVNVFADTFN